MSQDSEATQPEPDDDRTLRASDLNVTSDSGSLPLDDEPTEHRTIGPYVILRDLGRGGMGIVYEALEERLARTVALKVMTSRAWTEAGSLERFRREATMTSRLDHPGICQVYAAGAHDGLPFIAMQLVDGQSLAELIRSTPPPDDRAGVLEAVRIAEEASDALHAAHEAGVIHRDVKPGNIMVRSDGRAVLLDFGLARMDDDELPTLTQEGDIFGTPAYMSPERLSREGTVDRRCDVYAIGAVLYELLTGKRPFSAPTHQALFRSITEDAPVPIRRLNASVPQDLAVVIHTALEKSPDRRYGSAEALALDLGRVRKREPILARPPSVLGRLRRWAERKPAIAALILLAVVAIGATGGLGGWLLAELPKARLADEQARRAAVSHELEAAFLAYNEARWGIALQAFERVLDSGYHPHEAGLGLALSHVRRGDPTTALEVLDSMPASVRQNTGFRLVRYDTLMLLGRDDDAAKAIKDIPPPRSALDHFLAGLSLSLSGSPEDKQSAMNSFTRATLRSRTARALFHQQRGIMALQLGDMQTLGEVSDDLMSLWPDSAHSWVLQAYLLSGAPRSDTHESGGLVQASAFVDAEGEQMRRWPQALAAWRKALEIDPESVSAVVNIGVALHSMGRSDEALEHFQDATKTHGHLAVTWYNLGLAKQKASDSDGAIAAWKRALEADPKHLLTLRSLGSSLRAVDQAKAREFIDRALAARPGDAQTLVWSGVLHIDKGDVEAARAAWLAAIDSDPNHVRAHENLGMSYFEAADHETAAKHFTKAYILGGRRNLLLARRIATAHYKAGTPGEAIPILTEALERARKVPAFPKQGLKQLEDLLKALRQRAAREDDGDQRP